MFTTIDKYFINSRFSIIGEKKCILYINTDDIVVFINDKYRFIFPIKKDKYEYYNHALKIMKLKYNEIVTCTYPSAEFEKTTKASYEILKIQTLCGVSDIFTKDWIGVDYIFMNYIKDFETALRLAIDICGLRVIQVPHTFGISHYIKK